MTLVGQQLEMFVGSESDESAAPVESKCESISNWLVARRTRAIETIQQWFLSAEQSKGAGEEWSVPGVEVLETGSAENDEEAYALVARRYAERGYGMPPRDRSNPDEFTLLAKRGGRLIGTLTVNPGYLGRLGADAVFGEELSAVRATGRRLCEMTRLAVVDDIGSAPTLAALFGRAFAICRERFRVTDFVIEVNPRHVAFYKRALGFDVAAGERECPRVGAPAVLMRLDLDAIKSRLALVASRPMEELNACSASSVRPPTAHPQGALADVELAAA